MFVCLSHNSNIYSVWNWLPAWQKHFWIIIIHRFGLCEPPDFGSCITRNSVELTTWHSSQHKGKSLFYMFLNALAACSWNRMVKKCSSLYVSYTTFGIWFRSSKVQSGRKQDITSFDKGIAEQTKSQAWLLPLYTPSGYF